MEASNEDMKGGKPNEVIEERNETESNVSVLSRDAEQASN